MTCEAIIWLKYQQFHIGDSYLERSDPCWSENVRRALNERRVTQRCCSTAAFTAVPHRIVMLLAHDLIVAVRTCGMFFFPQFRLTDLCCCFLSLPTFYITLPLSLFGSLSPLSKTSFYLAGHYPSLSPVKSG